MQATTATEPMWSEKKILALSIASLLLAGCYETGAQRNSRIEIEKRVQKLERDRDSR